VKHKEIKKPWEAIGNIVRKSEIQAESGNLG
jgi:hypothetical protein